jgi:hypothetical protein
MLQCSTGGPEWGRQHLSLLESGLINNTLYGVVSSQCLLAISYPLLKKEEKTEENKWKEGGFCGIQFIPGFRKATFKKRKSFLFAEHVILLNLNILTLPVCNKIV